MKQILDLRQLRYFVAVAEDAQVTRAAERLHIAQPALSQAIAKLEGDLGVRLLDRHARGVTLTPAGEAFLPKARAALSAIEGAQDAISPWLPSDSRLVIGFLSVLGPVARPLLRRLMMRNPEVDVETRHIDMSSRLRLLREREIDAELLFPPPAEADLDVATVLQSPRYVVLSDRHRLAQEPSLVFDQIRNETFPGRHPSVPEQWAHDAWLSDYRDARPKRTVETPTTVDEVWAMISAGKAISVLPEFMVRHAASDGVRAIPLTDVEPLEVCIARRRDDRRAPVSALFEATAT
ncbi:MAG: LysR family transcriptional regulator [Solirubrobacteraceae bacterium]